MSFLTKLRFKISQGIIISDLKKIEYSKDIWQMFAKVISSCIWLLFTETRLISLSLSIALLLKTTFVFMRHKLILTADVLRWLWRDLFSTDDISLHVEVSFLPITLYKFMNSDLRFTKAEFHRHTVCKCRNVLRYVHLLSSQLKTSFLV